MKEKQNLPPKISFVNSRHKGSNRRQQMELDRETWRGREKGRGRPQAHCGVPLRRTPPGTLTGKLHSRRRRRRQQRQKKQVPNGLERGTARPFLPPGGGKRVVLTPKFPRQLPSFPLTGFLSRLCFLRDRSHQNSFFPFPFPVPFPTREEVQRLGAVSFQRITSLNGLNCALSPLIIPQFIL